MSSSIILQPVSAMRPQTTACCFCCLSAFNGLAFMPACLSVCVLQACGYPIITSLDFELQDVKRGKGRLKTMKDGAGERQSEKKDKRLRRTRGRDTGWLKNSCLRPPCWVLLVPEGRGPAPPLNSTAARAPNSTRSGCRAGGRWGAGPHILYTSEPVIPSQGYFYTRGNFCSCREVYGSIWEDNGVAQLSLNKTEINILYMYVYTESAATPEHQVLQLREWKSSPQASRAVETVRKEMDKWSK